MSLDAAEVAVEPAWAAPAPVGGGSGRRKSLPAIDDAEEEDVGDGEEVEDWGEDLLGESLSDSDSDGDE